MPKSAELQGEKTENNDFEPISSYYVWLELVGWHAEL
jgi:hypothetical protein